MLHILFFMSYPWRKLHPQHLLRGVATEYLQDPRAVKQYGRALFHHFVLMRQLNDQHLPLLLFFLFLL